jgi:hypothetical protein
MSDKPLKITFHMDGTGVVYDPQEPPTLDGVLAWCLSAYHVSGQPPRRDEKPFDIPVPLRKWTKNGTWGYHASAIFPEGPTAEVTQKWRCRLRENRIELTKGSPNRTNGKYRDWQNPIDLLLCHKMVAYAHGDRSDIQRILRRGVKYLGKKSSMGKGRVLSIDVEWIEEDFSLVDSEGNATRWLPLLGGAKFVRPRPPYWNNFDRIECCDIGDQYQF